MSTNDSMTQEQPINLLSFPLELHEHISIFLPTSSIPSLIMANRHFQFIYEKILYRHINLYAQPYRSNPLLRTFMQRPDLALLVLSLDIDLRPSVEDTLSGQEILLPAHRARLDALASAHNVNSFGLSGVAWLWGEDMKDIQDVVSKMKLTRLRIHESWPNNPEPQVEDTEGVYANLRAVLQGQPRLQDLELKYFLLRKEATDGVQIPIGFQSSDVLSLRTLNADAFTVASNLPVLGDQLESLEIHHWMDSDTNFLVTTFSSLTAVAGQLRKLHLSMRWIYSLGWDFDFGPALELFYNVKSLRITGVSRYVLLYQPRIPDALFEKVASQITYSPNLNDLEISLKFEFACQLDLDLLSDVDEVLRLNLKRSCPSLKRFIDPAEREWVFVSNETEEGGGNAFQAIKATSKNGSMAQQPLSQLLSFPLELYEHISIFLPTSSIPSLITANRHLRSIYEQILYRHINLYAQPHRSNALLRTFTLRSDLALLVRSLDIDLRWGEVNTLSGKLSLSPAHPARLDALASVRNVNSFGLSGVAWLWGEDMKDIQEVVSKMKLASLRIHEWWPTHSGPHLRNKAGAYANLCGVLQGQPRLRSLELKYFLLKMDAAYGVQIPIGIQSSVVPSLRTLRLDADVYTVASILPVVDNQLESLEIHNWQRNNTDFLATSFSSLTTATRRIRKLHLSMQCVYNLAWDFDFQPALELFPNLESLAILGAANFSLHDQPMLLGAYFEKVAAQITHSPNLIKLEMSLKFFRLEEVRVDDIDEELTRSLKRSCPSLKSFVDPAEQEWVFLPTEEGGGDALRAMKAGRLYRDYAHFRSGDLIELEWDV
ncbi:hypothetical protein FRC04_007383 [Tulasnella sp. 424]|nr:hypothetical protein FRC04_007383 [Tulasnella sp. 424]